MAGDNIKTPDQEKKARPQVLPRIDTPIPSMTGPGDSQEQADAEMMAWQSGDKPEDQLLIPDSPCVKQEEPTQEATSEPAVEAGGTGWGDDDEISLEEDKKSSERSEEKPKEKVEEEEKVELSEEEAGGWGEEDDITASESTPKAPDEAQTKQSTPENPPELQPEPEEVKVVKE